MTNQTTPPKKGWLHNKNWRNFIILLYFPLWLVGSFLCYLSKAMKMIGYLIMLHPKTAREELNRFWEIKHELRDL